MCGAQRWWGGLFIVAFLSNISFGFAMHPKSGDGPEHVKNGIPKVSSVTFNAKKKHKPKLTIEFKKDNTLIQMLEAQGDQGSSAQHQPIPRGHVTLSGVQIISDLELVHQSIKSFFEREKDPEKRDQIVLISDLDGVLTAEARPPNFYHLARATDELPPVPPRQDVIDALLTWNTRGVMTLVSSAWSQFDDSLQRIIDLNLAPVLGSVQELASNVINEFTIVKVISTIGEEKEFRFYQSGRVVSVDDHPNKGGGYLYKALSPLVVLSGEELKKVKKVIFIDDSIQNHTVFEEHSYRYNIYQANSEDPVEIERFYLKQL